MHRLIYLLLLPPLFFLVSCNQRTLSLFFDVPPPSEDRPAAAAQKAATTAPELVPISQQQGRPAIEQAATWPEAKKLLPKDAMGNADWMQALNQGVVRPRKAIPGTEKRDDALLFGFDFFLSGTNAMFDAYFPHSAHTEWLACDSCHPRIFPKRGAKISMEKINQGKYCGVCHNGQYAFSADNCARCHTKMGG